MAPSHKTAIATVCLSGRLDEKLHAIAAAGYDGVELFEDDILRFPGTLSEIQELCAELKLDVVMYQPFRDLEGWRTRQGFERSLRKLQKKFDWMDELGTDMVLVVSNCQPDATDEWDAWVRDLREAADIAATRKKRIAYEALAWGTHVNRWQQSWELVKAVDRVSTKPNFGICLDTFHIFSRGDEIESIAHVPSEKIFIVQLADAPYHKMDLLEWSRHYRVFPLQGEMPMGAFMEVLAATGYEGILSLEIFNDKFRDAPTLATAIDGLRSLRVLEADVGASARSGSVSPRPVCLGVEFIEFAVQGEASVLAQYIQSLGFKKVGTHRSKNVQRYSNGKISLVLNNEERGDGAKFYAQRGVSICALAWRVSDASSVVQRATALGYDLAGPQELGAREANIPAIKAPDGTLIYLVEDDSFWNMDFIMDRELAASPLYTRVDCIAAAVNPLGVESFILFYRALFEVDLGRQADVHDLYGLTRSWMLAEKHGSIRFLIATAQSNSTAVGRVMEASAGSALHSVAFQTDDIFRVAESLKTNSPDLFCAVPASYYDDLEVRYDLPLEYVRSLQSANILYERAPEGGSFLQLFTSPFLGKFYFQVVQRENGYEGVGVVNLAHQMAVHHTLLTGKRTNRMVNSRKARSSSKA